MKKLVIFFLVLLMLSFYKGDFATETAIVVTPESSLVIKVKTNVNKFDCKFNVQNLNNPIPVFFKVENSKLVFEETSLVLKNSCFDCGNKGINKDFYNLLNSDVYPEVVLKLKEVKIDNYHKNWISAKIDIKIAGVVNSYNVPLKLEGEERMMIKGVLNLNISDFNLEPPKKALGLIVVDEMIKIDLNLKVKEIGS
ncbi:hypothetical protein CLV33_10166 [Jejuia pallidilutea]|uniref:Lipid/polyisoprenoid-binding YceI-like domain-containing protein n=1 Tax=Jejuia pallidilutea TaxID=504487 RepID=A0A362X5X5_9FLAO|nr:YceI family protein [Jejuia pallidilutea]PQV51146.1 hypothetical protein CLV33_10166 [Jejuia pallidilutea]